MSTVLALFTLPGGPLRRTNEVWSNRHQEGDRTRLAVTECALLLPPPMPASPTRLLFVA